MSPNISAIVPAFNEEQTIGGVVRALVASKFFRDVIVVSDGSTDQTANEAKKAGASMVHQYPWKHGKGAAMLHGVMHTDSPILFFCDADLIGLTVEHIRSLIEPVVKGELAMCVGLRDRGRAMLWLEHFLPLIGGERALRRQVFESIPDKYLQGFMMETAMNHYCRLHHEPVGTRNLVGLHIRRKMQKVGVLRGAWQYLRMAYEMTRAAFLVRVAGWKGEI